MPEIELCYNDGFDPFARETLKIVDYGVSDDVYVVTSEIVESLRARVARLEEAGRELLEACEAADIEGDLSEHVSGDMMFNFRRALEEE